MESGVRNNENSAYIVKECNKVFFYYHFTSLSTRWKKEQKNKDQNFGCFCNLVVHIWG